MASSPYADLPPEAFWRTAVADRNPLQIAGLWTPKFAITPRDRVVTAGSCFAQHFSAALAARGYAWFDAEPAPSRMRESDARAYNYGVFSFRTGNIYTAGMLWQWLSWAFGEAAPDTEIWHRDGRFHDPVRPAIEPGGFASPDELLHSREAVFAALRKAVTETDLFVFTMGLTECWRNHDSGLEYAMCPGTVAGDFDPLRHRFVNQSYPGITRAMRASLRLMRRHNPDLRVLLTVSPVPLTATASGQHVLTATSHSKSVLRAVAGDLAAAADHVDYFPSYEIITHPAFRGMFYAPNQRSVVPQGVDFVMQNFFADQARVFPQPRPGRQRRPAARPLTADEIRCEEETLNAFAH